MAVSKWTHAICQSCWEAIKGDQEPVCLTEPVPEKCCYCEVETRFGAYIRGNPTETPCKGVGGPHIEEGEGESANGR